MFPAHLRSCRHYLSGAAVMRKAFWVFGWLVLAAIVVAAARSLDAAGTLRALREAEPRWLLLAVTANAIILPVATLQWLLFLPGGIRVGFRKMFGILAVTTSVSNAPPCPAALVAQLHLLAHRAGLGHAGAASFVLLEQTVEGLAKLALVALAAALVPGLTSRGAGFVIVLGVPALVVAVAWLARKRHGVERFAAAATGWRRGALDFLVRAIQALDAIRRPAPFAGAVALGLAKKALEAAGIAAAAAAFGLVLPFWLLVAVAVAVNISIVFAPTPAAVGIWEGAAFLVLTSAGVEADRALAVALVAHAAYLLPLVSTGWILESLRLGGALARRLALAVRGNAILLGGLALVGLAIHGWFALGGNALDSDRALILLMAQAFARGEFSVFLWEQNYMAALEPLLLTPLAALGRATPVTAGFLGIALTAGLAALSVGLVRRLGGAPWVALLLWAAPPALVVHHHVALYGARLAATLLAVGAFAWSLHAERRASWVAVGFLVGAAFFADHLMLPWAAAAVFTAARRGGVGPLALGALPVVALDTVLAVLTPAVHLAGPNDPQEWLGNLPRLFGTALPQLFGFLLSRPPTPVFEAIPPVVPEGILWPLLALPGAVALAALALTLVRRRREIFGHAAPLGGTAEQALLLACATGLGIFAFVGGGGDIWSVRYLVPLWPAFTVLAALAANRWPARVRPLAAALVLPAVFTLLADRAWPRAGDGTRARAEAEAVAAAVRQSGARVVYADYWDTSRLELLTGSEVPWLTLNIIERHPVRAREALRDGPVGYLLRETHTEGLHALSRAPEQGVRILAEEEVGRFRLVLAERPVPGVAAPARPGSRAWQVTAALAAGASFVVMFVAVGFLGGPPPPLRRALDLLGRPGLRGIRVLFAANASVVWTWFACSALAWAVQLALGMGHPSQGLALSAAALPAAVVAALPGRWRRGGMVAVVGLTALLAVANALHHRAFQTYLPLRELVAIGQGWAVRGSAAELLRPADLVPVLLLLGTVAGALAASRRERKRHRIRPSGAALPLALSLLGSAPALIWAYRVAPAYADNQTGGFLYGHLVDACRLARDWLSPSDLTPEDLARILRATAHAGPGAEATTSEARGTMGRAHRGNGEGAAPDPWFGRAAGANVLMIQVEALNGWVLNAEVEGTPVAPFLRSLAGRGLVFTGVFDETHLGRSSDADYLALVSLHPTQHDAVAMSHPEEAVVALPGVLRDRGYATLAAHAHVPGFWNARVRRARYGFQEQLYASDLGPGESLGFGLVDAEMFRRTAPHITALPRPWLAWLVTLTMHEPHLEVPSSFPRLPLGELEGTRTGAYLRKLRHTDDALREFLAGLEGAGVLDSTLVVVYGDHAELRELDPAWVEKMAGIEGLPADVQRLLLERVALIVVPPGPAEPHEIARPGGLIDVAPTVLHLLGVEPPRSFLGRTLLGSAPALAARVSGEVVGEDLMWTGAGCYRFSDGVPHPPAACDRLRERAQEELEVSWLITRHGMGPWLAQHRP